MEKVQLLSEYVLLNMFKGDFPTNYIGQAISNIENHPAKNWNWSLASILDLYLHGIDSWDNLTAEERSILAKEILEHLHSMHNKL